MTGPLTVVGVDAAGGPLPAAGAAAVAGAVLAVGAARHLAPARVPAGCERVELGALDPALRRPPPGGRGRRRPTSTATP